VNAAVCCKLPEVAVTVTVEVEETGVGVGDVPPPMLPPPQPMMSPRQEQAVTSISQCRQPRRFLHGKRPIVRASAVSGRNGRGPGRKAEVPETATVTEVVTALPAGVTVAGAKEQVAVAGSPEQAKLTAELKPFCGVTVRVTDPWLPELTVNEAGDAPRVKLGGGVVTVNETVVAPVRLPPVPVTVMV